MLHEITCPFCPGSSSHPAIEENGFTGRQCDTCGLIFVSPRPSQAEIAELYEDGDAYLPPEYFIWSSRSLTGRLNAWHNVRLLARHARSGGSVLEIGPGAGTFLERARQSGFDPYGVELNPQQADHIRSQLGIPCAPSLEEARSLGPEQFDVVYHCDVISHFYDPIAEMRKLDELIRPGGLHIFETGNLGDVDHRHFKLFTAFQYPDHLFFYSDRSLQKLRAAIGLEHVTTYRYSILAQHLLRDQIRRLSHRGDGNATAGGPGNGAADESGNGAVGGPATGAGTATGGGGESVAASRPRMPSRSGLLARDALDLGYLGLRLGLGRFVVRHDDPQTLIVVARKPK